MSLFSNERELPPPHADERTMLVSWLDFHRSTLLLKCGGLRAEQLTEASVPPSPITLLGLVQHLAQVERNWFQRIFAGADAPPVFTPVPSGWHDPTTDFERSVRIWQNEIARGREILAGASLDDRCTLPAADAAATGATTLSMRWILVHLIEEYARHNGHADLIRERIDGRTGA